MRSLRGHSQARLIEVSPGHAYTTKLQCNPLGPRLLAAEWIGWHLMQHLGLPAPNIALIEAPPHAKHALVDADSIPAGIHFGSEFPGDPSAVAVYDFIPARLLTSIENRHTFAGAFVFDMWVANADLRQAIFYRNRGAGRTFNALFIDSSHIFGGLDWSFAENKSRNMDFSHIASDCIRDWKDLLPWLERIEQSDRHIVEKITSSVPKEWLAKTNVSDLNRINKQLEYRGRILRESVRKYIRLAPGKFPNWHELRPCPSI